MHGYFLTNSTYIHRLWNAFAFEDCTLSCRSYTIWCHDRPIGQTFVPAVFFQWQILCFGSNASIDDVEQCSPIQI